jgi:DNA-binding beta-propeller fold protein YncE
LSNLLDFKMVLEIKYTMDLPHHDSGGFDHGDVMENSGIGFVAHTAAGSIEMYDGVKGVHMRTIPSCLEASGVICAQAENLAIAASRGTGKILVLDGSTGALQKEIQVGTKPNGMAWDNEHKMFLAADVGDSHVRIVNPFNGKIIADQVLPGKPRWCKYSTGIDRYIVNLADKASVALLDPETATVDSLIPVSVAGPHGLDIDPKRDLAYVACDGGAVVVLDLVSRKEVGKVSIPMNPDVAWFNDSKRLLYCAVSRPGVVEVVDTDGLKVVQELPTEEGCHTFAFHQREQTLHAYLNRSCKLAVYSEK